MRTLRVESVCGFYLIPQKCKSFTLQLSSLEVVQLRNISRKFSGFSVNTFSLNFLPISLLYFLILRNLNMRN